MFIISCSVRSEENPNKNFENIRFAGFLYLDLPVPNLKKEIDKIQVLWIHSILLGKLILCLIEKCMMDIWECSIVGVINEYQSSNMAMKCCAKYKPNQY